MPNVLSFPVGL